MWITPRQRTSAASFYDAFDNSVELAQGNLETIIGTMIPLSQTMEEQIRGIRDWAKLRARRASAIEWEEDSGAKRQLEIQ